MASNPLNDFVRNHQDRPLAGLLHFGRRRVGPPPMNSRSWPTRTGGFSGSNISIPRNNGDDDKTQPDAKTFVNALASPRSTAGSIPQDLGDAEVADLQKKLQASDQPAATKQHICDYDDKGVFDGILLRMISASFVSTSSCLAYTIQIPSSTSRSCLPTTRRLPRLKTFPGRTRS